MSLISCAEVDKKYIYIFLSYALIMFLMMITNFLFYYLRDNDNFNNI